MIIENSLHIFKNKLQDVNDEEMNVAIKNLEFLLEDVKDITNDIDCFINRYRNTYKDKVD